MPADIIRDRTGTPPYVTPYLDALDRLHGRSIVRPEKLTELARRLLDERFGSAGRSSESAFAHGAAGLLADHTHYFDGFAILKSLPMGTAVAIRTTSARESRIVFEGGAETWSFDASMPSVNNSPEWVRIAEGVIRRLSPDAHQVDAAIVSTVPACCVDGYQAALGISVARAAQSLFSRAESGEEVQQVVREVIADIIQQPFGIAYPMASDVGRPEYLLLVDANTLERLPIAAPGREDVGWGMVDVGMGPLRDASFHVKRLEMAEEATETLRRKGFPSLHSLRELEHKDLKQALDVLPRRLRPIVRHLVTENRRVQKLVAAVRRRDWQLLGALLLMSHSSLQKDWEATNELVDAVVLEAEAMSLEGIYGACMTGRGGCVLVAGQPFSVPRCLDRAQGALREQFEIEADVMLL
ncbi:MAG: hypothetical protein WED81_01565 [Rhodothermales bacterium]